MENELIAIRIRKLWLMLDEVESLLLKVMSRNEELARALKPRVLLRLLPSQPPSL